MVHTVRRTAGGHSVSTVAILVLVVIITFNLRFIYQESKTSTADSDFLLDPTDCSRPVVISITGNLSQSPRSELRFNSGFLHRPRYNDSHVTVIGYQRNKTNFLSIGVPSIRRVNGDVYVLRTVQSLVDESDGRDKLRTTVIVLLSDLDELYNQQVAEKLESRFRPYIQIGFLQIVRVSPDYYPRLDGLKHTFRDSEARVKWRSKQVADFAFLFLYAQNQSRYYLQLEDDVLASSGYLRDISGFIQLQASQPSWAVLEFSELGFIGKLFKNEDLSKLTQFMLTFYQEQPVDWLLAYYRRVMTQNEVILRKPTLFQHIGKTSSFDTSRDNNLRDRFFAGDRQKKWQTDDPPAAVLSTMQHHDNNFVQLVYASGSGMFWARDPRQGDTVSVVFESPQRLRQVVVETGNAQHPHDVLRNGTVEVSSTLIRMDASKGRVVCAAPRVIGQLENGRCLVENVTAVFNAPVRCVTVTVTADQFNWVAFDQIGVFLENVEMP